MKQCWVSKSWSSLAMRHWTADEKVDEDSVEVITVSKEPRGGHIVMREPCALSGWGRTAVVFPDSGSYDATQYTAPDRERCHDIGNSSLHEWWSRPMRHIIKEEHNSSAVTQVHGKCSGSVTSIVCQACSRPASCKVACICYTKNESSGLEDHTAVV